MPSLLRNLAWASMFAPTLAVDSKEKKCSCGFYDPISQHLFTEYMVVYFNETELLPIHGFVVEEYQHAYEQGWNTQFREGASLSNANITSQPRSLELKVSPAQQDHLVIGSSLRSSRRDIQYGSFSALLRSPGPWAGGGGSTLSMALQYNSSQSVSLDLRNTNLPSTASINMLENGELPDSKLNVRYDDITSGTFGNGTLSSQWDFVECCVVWTQQEIKFFVGGHLARRILKDDNRELFSTSSPLYFRHWSNGNSGSSQGPPKQPTTASVGWLRAFFNSSSMTEDDHKQFNERCREAEFCSSNDISLRGMTPYPQAADLEWHQKPILRAKRWPAIGLAISCIALTSFLLLSPVWKRLRERANKRANSKYPGKVQPEDLGIVSELTESRAAAITELGKISGSNRTTLPSVTITAWSETWSSSACATPSSQASSSSGEPNSDVTTNKARRRSVFCEDYSLRSCSEDEVSNDNSDSDTLCEPALPKKSHEVNRLTRALPSEVSIYKPNEKQSQVSSMVKTGLNDQWVRSDRTEADSDQDTKELDCSEQRDSDNLKVLSATKERVDYLAGLVVVSCLLVTAIHFSLTFVYGDLNAGAFTHYHSEVIARKSITSYFLNLVWIGPFLTTSTRFLVSDFLRTGELLFVAEKAVGRVPRLMGPIIAMILLEYFFIDAGATKWLEYLSSVSWSTWPYTVGFTNFGSFLNEVIELMYLIPNAVPMITFNYCTGVLWTVPVQLQGSWLALLALIVVREIRKPWKRFGFYCFCIVSHWYARSWGSYFYLGIALVDLDITYKWRSYLHTRPIVYYPLLLVCCTLSFGALTLDLVAHWTEVEYATYEYAIHPDINSGLTIAQAGHTAYPEYYVPRLHGIVFAVGLQAAIELSPFVQKIFSFKLLVVLFRHTFTIYSFHGFVFWALGSWLCITLAARGLSYWLNLLIVATCCYTAIAFSLPMLTPVLESLGKTITADTWKFAHEAPVPRQPTLYPFRSDLLDRDETLYETKSREDTILDLTKASSEKQDEMGRTTQAKSYQP